MSEMFPQQKSPSPVASAASSGFAVKTSPHLRFAQADSTYGPGSYLLWLPSNQLAKCWPWKNEAQLEDQLGHLKTF